MKILQNIAVGFLVSFAGSVPLGYLNIAGYELFSTGGWHALLTYVLGVILIEVVVIYATLVFANRLASEKKLIRGIEIFSIVFMLALAVLFFIKSESSGEPAFFRKYFIYTPFVIGIILNATNFMQLPFWTAWNLYVVNNGYIRTSNGLKMYYILGTLVGSFSGITIIAVGLDYAGRSSAFVSTYLMPYLLPGVFLLIATYQIILYYRKYHLASR